MASNLTSLPTQQSRRKDLKCGICQDIFKSPKLLPCFHSFCLRCLEQLIAVKGSPFQCPSCRNMTFVPLEGARVFQSNMYITESELERARENLTPCRLHANYDEPLTFFCVTCDDAICWRCKLTKHEGHRCEDLTKEDERSKRLAGAKRALDDTMDCLKDNLKDSEDHLRQVQRKKTAITEQVHAQHDSLVAMATKWKNTVLKVLDKNTEDIQVSVNSEKLHLQSKLDTCRKQWNRVQQVMNNLLDNKQDVAEAERVLRTYSETDSWTQRVRGPASTPIQRPGLDCSIEVIQEDDIRRFIGIPFVLTLSPKSGVVRETITRFYQCVEEGRPHQVLALCVTSEGNVHCMYGDAVLGGNQWGKRSISSSAQTLRDNKVSQRFVFRKFSNGKKYCIAHHNVNNGISLNAKSGSLAQIHYVPPTSGDAASCCLSDILVVDDPTLNLPKLSSHQFVQKVHTVGRPLALDVTADSNLLVVLEEDRENLTEGKEKRAHGPGRRLVRLYRRGQEDCIATYNPPDPNSFFPTDVCFWRSGGKERLLVADYTNDSVHVINVHVINAHKGRCVLQRYLAAGSGDLVKPTAFDTDFQGRLWVACGNGWILKCEAIPGMRDDENDDEADDDNTGERKTFHSGRQHEEREDSAGKNFDGKKTTTSPPQSHKNSTGSNSVFLDDRPGPQTLTRGGVVVVGSDSQSDNETVDESNG